MSLYDDGLFDERLDILHDLLLLLQRIWVGLLLPSSRGPCLKKHQLAHHLDLFSSDVGDFLLMLFLTLHLCQALTKHHHVALGQALLYD